MTLKWEDPPPAGGPDHSNWLRIAEELRDRPGQWALVLRKNTPAQAATCAWQIRSGHRAGMPKGEFEARARLADVYVRYIGGAS